MGQIPRLHLPSPLPMEPEIPLFSKPPRWMDALVLLAVLTVIGVGCYVSWCRAPLLWDGAYQFAETLRAGSPYVYLSRFHTRILWQPVVWFMPFTDNVRLLQFVYGLPFLLAPAVGLAVSWWFVRQSMPTLIVWAAIGIVATPLPGQIFVINDSIFQQHLFWPVLFGLCLPLTRRQKIVLALLVPFQFVHQIGLILLAGAALTAGVLAWQRRRQVPRAVRLFPGWADGTRNVPATLILAIALTLLMAAKVWWTSTKDTPYYDSYAAAEATWQFAKDRWWRSVWGNPFNGLLMVWIAAGILCLQAWLFTRPGRDATARKCSAIALMVLVAGAIQWTTWADNPASWVGAIEYRRWLVPMTLPAFILAAIEMWWRLGARAASPASGRRLDPIPDLGASRSEDSDLRPEAGEDARAPGRDLSLPPRAAVIALLAAVYAIVLFRQSKQIDAMTTRFEADIAASPAATIVLPPDHWIRGTALDHWSLGWHSLVLQGKSPTKWVVPTDLPPEKLSALEAGRVPVDKFVEIDPSPGTTGWFDARGIFSLSPVLRGEGWGEGQNVEGR